MTKTKLQLYYSGDHTVITPIERISPPERYGREARVISDCSREFDFKHTNKSGIWLGPEMERPETLQLAAALRAGGFKIVLKAPPRRASERPTVETKRLDIKMLLLRLDALRLVYRAKLRKISRKSRRLEKRSARL